MIRCEGLTKSYEGDGIADLTLSVQPGEALGLLGPGGAGKSLTLRVLMGQIRADAGTAEIAGNDCWKKRREVQKKVAYAPASPVLEEEATGENYLRFVGRFRGGFNPKKARDFAQRLDVGLTGSCRRMSPENRKKLSLLAAFSLDRDVLLLDEPSVGLGSLARSALLDAVASAREAGCAVLMTFHALEEARRFSSHVAIIRKGRLVLNQPVSSLSQTRQKVYHVTFATAQEAARFAAEWEAGVELFGSRAMVAIPASPQVLLKTLARYDVSDLVGGRDEGEEGFLRFYGDDIV